MLPELRGIPSKCHGRGVTGATSQRSAAPRCFCFGWKVPAFGASAAPAPQAARARRGRCGAAPWRPRGAAAAWGRWGAKLPRTERGRAGTCVRSRLPTGLALHLVYCRSAWGRLRVYLPHISPSEPLVGRDLAAGDRLGSRVSPRSRGQGWGGWHYSGRRVRAVRFFLGAEALGSSAGVLLLSVHRTQQRG